MTGLSASEPMTAAASSKFNLCLIMFMVPLVCAYLVDWERCACHFCLLLVGIRPFGVLVSKFHFNGFKLLNGELVCGGPECLLQLKN